MEYKENNKKALKVRGTSTLEWREELRGRNWFSNESKSPV